MGEGQIVPKSKVRSGSCGDKLAESWETADRTTVCYHRHDGTASATVVLLYSASTLRVHASPKDLSMCVLDVLHVLRSAASELMLVAALAFIAGWNLCASSGSWCTIAYARVRSESRNENHVRKLILLNYVDPLK